jgi:hypothetical protein
MDVHLHEALAVRGLKKWDADAVAERWTHVEVLVGLVDRIRTGMRCSEQILVNV